MLEIGCGDQALITAGGGGLTDHSSSDVDITGETGMAGGVDTGLRPAESGISANLVLQIHGDSEGLKLGSWLFSSRSPAAVLLAAPDRSQVVRFDRVSVSGGKTTLTALVASKDATSLETDFIGLVDVGDIDLDGVVDVGILRKESNGHTLAILRSKDWDSVLIADALEMAIPVIEGDNEMMLASYQGAVDAFQAQHGISDLDGDGTRDFIVWLVNQSSDEPRFAVLPGSLSPGRHAQALASIDIPAAQAPCATIPGSAGDFDGNGRADIAFFANPLCWEYQQNLNVSDPFAGPAVLGYQLHGLESLSGARIFADLNADGRDDLLIGVPGWGLTLARGSSQKGTCYPSGIFKFGDESQAIPRRYGWALIAVPDVTGDGIPEIVLTAPNVDQRGQSANDDGGEFFVVSGAVFADTLGASQCASLSSTATGLLSDLVDSGDAIVVQAPHGTFDFGHRLAEAGDPAGPAGVTIAVSAPSASEEADNGGAVYLYSISKHP